jgi:hypothetical protein
MRFHPRIHPVNYSLLREFASDHPAVTALQIHAEARDTCVGKEIEWPHSGVLPVDQKWWSDVDYREHYFSSFAYSHISYDLFLDGWVEAAPEPTEAELGFLEDAPKMRTLLDECERAAHEENTVEILPLISKAREFFDALEHAILYRFKEFRIPYPPSAPKQVRND